MIYVGNEDYKWGTYKFFEQVGYEIAYPQIFVSEYPFSDKWFFEIAETTTVPSLRVISTIKALPGSFIDGKTGKSFDRGINIPVDFIRLPTLEEIFFMKNILSYNQISNKEMNKVILEKVPLEERLKSVYLPIIAMDCACYLSEELLEVLVQLRLSITKQISRNLHDCINKYRSDNSLVMRSDLYHSLSEKTKEIYKFLSMDIFVCQIQYKNLLFKVAANYDSELCKVIALVYVIREVTRYVLKLDRYFTTRISTYLGRNIIYTTEDDKHCLDLIKSLNDLLKLFGVRDDLKNEQIDLAIKIFKNKINAIDIWTQI